MPFSAETLLAPPILQVGVITLVRYPGLETLGIASVTPLQSSGYLNSASNPATGNTLVSYVGQLFQYIPLSEGLESILVPKLEVTFSGLNAAQFQLAANLSIASVPYGWYCYHQFSIPSQIKSASDFTNSFTIRLAYNISNNANVQRVYTVIYNGLAGVK